MAIVWTKYWAGTDDGTILRGIDLRNIQDDLAVVQTVDAVLTIPGQVQGDVLYYNGSTWVRLGAGTTGQFLKTNGTGANPAWTDPTATDLSITSQAIGDILYFNGTDWVRLAAGTAGQLLQANGAAAPTWVAAPSSPNAFIMGGSTTVTSTDVTTVHLGGLTWLPAEGGNPPRIPWYLSGTFSYLTAYSSPAQPGTIVLEFEKNSVMQPLVCTIPSNDVGPATDSSNSFSITSGDNIRLSITNNRGISMKVWWYCKFTPA